MIQPGKQKALPDLTIVFLNRFAFWRWRLFYWRSTLCIFSIVTPFLSITSLWTLVGAGLCLRGLPWLILAVVASRKCFRYLCGHWCDFSRLVRGSTAIYWSHNSSTPSTLATVTSAPGRPDLASSLTTSALLPCGAAKGSWDVLGSCLSIRTWSHCLDMDSGEFSQATCCGEGICHAGRSGRQRPGTMDDNGLIGNQQCWPALSNIQPFFKTKTGFVEHCWLERLEGFTVWMFMMVYASVMTMSDNHDRCWSSVNVSGRREAWKWTARQTRQRWAKLVTHSDTTLRKSHDLKQKRDLSCRRDAGLTELIIKNEDIGGESALSS